MEETKKEHKFEHEHCEHCYYGHGRTRLLWVLVGLMVLVLAFAGGFKLGVLSSGLHRGYGKYRMMSRPMMYYRYQGNFIPDGQGNQFYAPMMGLRATSTPQK